LQSNRTTSSSLYASLSALALNPPSPQLIKVHSNLNHEVKRLQVAQVICMSIKPMCCRLVVLSMCVGGRSIQCEQGTPSIRCPPCLESVSADCSAYFQSDMPASGEDSILRSSRCVQVFTSACTGQYSLLACTRCFHCTAKPHIAVIEPRFQAAMLARYSLSGAWAIAGTTMFLSQRTPYLPITMQPSSFLHHASLFRHPP
jgi:hypothetical protein